MLKILFILSLCSFSLASSIKQQKSLAVTIYNDNFAMVKDVREIDFSQGESTLYFTDVAQNIQTETVTFKAVNDPTSIRVYEQNFEQNLINTDGILKKYIEKDVDIYVELGTTARKVSGKLLGYNSGYILQTKTGIQIFNKIAGIEFSSLPEGFFTTPTLNWKVFSEKAATTPCEVAYRTTGFSWKADYSLTLNSEETLADIGGWVTIDNNSGKKYTNAKLKLIAGDVNTVSNANNNPNYLYSRVESFELSAPSFEEKSFADYHLYTLSQPVTLNESSQKQVEFVPKVFNVSVEKYHEIGISAGGYAETGLKARNYVRFLNSEKNGLGIAFPKGTVRVFKEDNADGSLEFIGEDSIDHTPKNENITISTGNAFDIVAEKTVKSRTNTDNQGGYTAETSIKVTNHKETSADIVLIFANGYGDNLRITMQNNASAPEKKSASEYRWRKVVPAGEVWELSWKEDYFR